ncbi:MAG: amidohydrolase family protein [Candidatus Bathyarchaeota archaeon]|nr:MAG: amidohydrolase family protein [Candidatus Bathyarchaeota archaeon]
MEAIVLVNGNIVTLDPSKPRARALAIWDEWIIGVGTNEEMLSVADKNARIIDLEGRTVLPGFSDSHVHLIEYGLMLSSASLDVREAGSIDEIKTVVKKRAEETPPEAWITGHGWDTTVLAEGRPPSRWDLDEAAPNNPVMITDMGGHLCSVNSIALRLANIGKDSESPPGGKIDKDPESGDPTGILRETAASKIEEMIEYSDETLVSALNFALQEAVGFGITSIHCIVHSPQDIGVFQKLLVRDELPLRVYLMISASLLPHLAGLGLHTGFGNPKLKIGAIKVMLDGSIEGYTAYLTKPYEEEPDNLGIPWLSNKELLDIVTKAHEAGFQLAIHAIGDRAINMALDSLETALEKMPKTDHRHRIEHASLLDEKSIRRMKNLEVIASVQPNFISPNMDWMLKPIGSARATKLGERYRTLIDAGVKVTGGSDCPADSTMNPLVGIQSAVTRHGFAPEERITKEEAISLYTINPAHATFEEESRGSIKTGKLADLIVLSNNPLKIANDKIGNIKVDMTIVNGEIVYTRKG